jgi:DNA adenine methylase
MRDASPLRYPGGKAALTELLRGIRRLNHLGDRVVAEPFAGGAGASLSLLFLEETHRVVVNDADPAIQDFWWSLVNRSSAFLGLLQRTRINIAEWKRQRDTYRRRRGVSRLRRGFAAFYLNRCNRSGIIMNGGPIGGVKQTGEWTLRARFNKQELRRRCEKVAEFGDRIELSRVDGIVLLETLDSTKTFFFVDPPYYHKGPTLYLNALDDRYHSALAERLRELSNAAWVLTYDDCPEVRRFYRGWANIRPFCLRYVASERRTGKEVLITPKWMRLPRSQSSAALLW